MQEQWRSATMLAGILAMLVLASNQSAAQICGDCNNDGVVSILDALKAAQISAAIVAAPAPHCFEEYSLCNVSGDLCPLMSSVITITDALVLAQVAAGLPVPYGCGTPLGQPPACSIIAPTGGTLLGDVTVTFDPVDPDTLVLTVTVRWTSDAGSTFQLATVAPTSPAPMDMNPGTAMPGSTYDFLWDTVTDIGVTLATVQIQIEVDDGMNSSTCLSPPFDVDNVTWRACSMGGVSILNNPGFETGTMAGWNPGVYIPDVRAHDGAWSAWGMGNNPVVQTFPAVPCSQITEWNYWAMHPTENVFGVTEYTYSDSTTGLVIHSPWQSWTYFDLLSTLNPTKNLIEIRVWGYSGGSPTSDETIFDSFNLCWLP